MSERPEMRGTDFRCSLVTRVIRTGGEFGGESRKVRFVELGVEVRHETEEIRDLAANEQQDIRMRDTSCGRTHLKVFVYRFSGQFRRKGTSIEVLLSINDLFYGSESNPIRASLVTEDMTPAAASFHCSVRVQEQGVRSCP